MPDLIISATAWFFVWLFGFAAFSKMRAPAEYQLLMSAYLDGREVGAWQVWAVALTEVLIVIVLLVPGASSLGLLLASLVLFFYAALMLQKITSGNADMRCGCGGSNSGLVISPHLVIRNLVCICLALACLLPPYGIAGPFAGAGFSLMLCVFLIFTYLSADQLIENAQHIGATA